MQCRTERAMDRPFFIVVRCVVVVTQDEADFRFGLSPEGAQAQWREGGRLLAEAELRRVVAVGGGETKTFARLVHLKRSSRTNAVFINTPQCGPCHFQAKPDPRLHLQFIGSISKYQKYSYLDRIH